MEALGLTVEEAVVFEAASAEERVEGVQALLPLHRPSVWTVDVGGALGGEGTGQLLLRQLLIPDDTEVWNISCLTQLTHTHTHALDSYLCEDSHTHHAVIEP